MFYIIFPFKSSKSSVLLHLHKKIKSTIFTVAGELLFNYASAMWKEVRGSFLEIKCSTIRYDENAGALLVVQ